MRSPSDHPGPIGSLRPRRRNPLALCLLAASLSLPACRPAKPGPDKVNLPPGFRIAVYADDVPGARSMTLGTAGTLFVGSRDIGRLYAIQDLDHDNKADRVITIARDLNSPNGVAFRDGSLYVAEISRVIRFDDIEKRLDNPPQPVVVNDTFPTDKHHGWKFIAFGPDGKLYVPVGAPCNDCKSQDERFATIMRMNPDGTGLEVFARGVRNTVGFDWHPQTHELWFTDNGRDWLGDDQPPDELNRAPAPGMNFGFPYWHGRNIPDPGFGDNHRAGEFTPPVAELGAHVAALGMRFYTGSMFPPEFRNQIFIAEHGSWNRTIPVGYRLTVVRLQDNQATEYEVFADGWPKGEQATTRPVDVQVMPDGALLFSDDRGGKIYRISYSAK